MTPANCTVHTRIALLRVWLTCWHILAANPAFVAKAGYLLEYVVVVEFPFCTWLMSARHLRHLNVSYMHNGSSSPHLHSSVHVAMATIVQSADSLPMMAMLSARRWTMLPSILCAWKMSIRRRRFGELTSSKIPLAGWGEEHKSNHA